MTLRTGFIIKHKNYLDICLKLIDVFDYGHGYKLKTEVWNMGFVESFNTGQKRQLNLAKKPEDIKDKAGRYTSQDEYLVLQGHGLNEKCYRYGTWGEING